MMSNMNNIMRTLGASSYTDKERQEEDFYATDPIAAKLLLSVEELAENIWEPSCGQGHFKVFEQHGHKVKSTDLIDRGFGEGGIDFLKTFEKFDGDIVTNPPFSKAQQFIEHGLSLIPDGRKVCMFLKVQFMEGKARKQMFLKHPPKTVYVSSSRILCAKNADFEGMKAGGGSAVAYAWYVWEKGYDGKTTLDWIN